MTSPTVETFCCLHFGSHSAANIFSRIDSTTYNTICLCSALFGCVGALYQLIPYEKDDHYHPLGEYKLRLRKIISFLALGDLCAILGIIVRSIIWLHYDSGNSYEPTFLKHGTTWCIFTSTWIHYFYLATYLWTFIYALEMYFIILKLEFKFVWYHLFSWGGALSLTLSSLLKLYYPDLQCHVTHKQILFDYLISYVPLAIIFILNPLIYMLASSRLKYALRGNLGRFTDYERDSLDKLNEKFFHIVIVFYVCWIPNILNGIIVISYWDNLPADFLITLWFMMAILNPFQAVLNSLVYKGWESCSLHMCLWQKKYPFTYTDSSEIEPLLISSSHPFPTSIQSSFMEPIM